MTTLYIGCYTRETGGTGTGIETVHADERTGRLTTTGLFAATPSPSFLTRHPTLPVLYAANELPEGTVTAWTLPTGTPLSTRPTGGADPCHLTVHADHLVTVNYSGGTVAVHPLAEDGAIHDRSDLRRHTGSGPDPRQKSPHPHMVRSDEHGNLLVVDLGTDQVHPYALTAGHLTPNGAPTSSVPGTGPRHLAIGGGTRYLVGELTGTVNGHPTSRADTPNWPSEVALSSDGRRLYVANRGPDTIAVFDTDTMDLVAEVPSGGEWPRHFAIHGDWLYVANERSHTVASFHLDTEGLPTPTGFAVETGSPTCVLPLG